MGKYVQHCREFYTPKIIVLDEIKIVKVVDSLEPKVIQDKVQYILLAV